MGSTTFGKIPMNDYSGMGSGWGAQPISPWGGQDYLAQLQNPALGGIDMGGGSLLNTRPDFFSMDGFLGNTGADGTKNTGWGGAALGVAQGLGNAWMSMKQYGLAKDTFAENKRQFNLNFGNQQKLVNSQLEDRQRARVASNPDAYQSVGDYMKKNGI